MDLDTFRNYAFATKVGSQVLVKDAQGNEQLLTMLFDDVKVQGNKIPLYEVTVSDIDNIDEAELVKLVKDAGYRTIDVDECGVLLRREAARDEKGEMPRRWKVTASDCYRDYNYAVQDANDDLEICAWGVLGSCMAAAVIGGWFGGGPGALLNVLATAGIHGSLCIVKYKKSINRAESRLDNCLNRVATQTAIKNVAFVDMIR